MMGAKEPLPLLQNSETLKDLNHQYLPLQPQQLQPQHIELELENYPQLIQLHLLQHEPELEIQVVQLIHHLYQVIAQETLQLLNQLQPIQQGQGFVIHQQTRLPPHLQLMAYERESQLYEREILANSHPLEREQEIIHMNNQQQQDLELENMDHQLQTYPNQLDKENMEELCHQQHQILQFPQQELELELETRQIVQLHQRLALQ